MAKPIIQLPPTVGEGKPVINEGFAIIGASLTTINDYAGAIDARVLRLEGAAGFPNGAYIPDMGADGHRRAPKVNPAGYTADTATATGQLYSSQTAAVNTTTHMPIVVLGSTETYERILVGGASSNTTLPTPQDLRFTVFERDVAGGAWSVKGTALLAVGSGSYAAMIASVTPTSPTTALIEVGRADSVSQQQLSYDEGTATPSLSASTPNGNVLPGLGTLTGNIPPVNKKGRMTPAGLALQPRPFELGLRQPSVGAPSLTFQDTGLLGPVVQRNALTARITHDFLASDVLLVANYTRTLRANAQRIVLSLLIQDAEGHFNIEHRLPLADGTTDISQVWALSPSLALVQVFNTGARIAYLIGVETDANGRKRLVNRSGALTAGAAGAQWPFVVRTREGAQNGLLIVAPGNFSGGVIPLTITPLIVAADGTVSTGTARTLNVFGGLGFANAIFLDASVLPSGRIGLMGWGTTNAGGGVNGQLVVQSIAAS